MLDTFIATLNPMLVMFTCILIGFVLRKTKLAPENTGEVLSFRNVLILHMNMKTLDNTLMKIDVVGSGTGYFACDGQIIPILWSRSSESENYVYTLEDGTPLTLGVGKTYVALLPLNGHVEVE